MKLEHIKKTLGNTSVIDDFTYTFTPSATTCILGRSGCGKSTLMHIAAGLLKPDKGVVEPHRVRASVLFQDDRLLPWYNILKNITVHGVSEKDAFSYLAKVGLNGEEHKLPGELSGGMRRRAAIARALAYRGDVYFLDEPFRGLDQATKMMVLEVIKGELANKTALVITHDVDEALILHHQILITSGLPLKIEAQFAAGELKTPQELISFIEQISKEE